MSAPEYQSTFWLLALPLEGRLERGEEGTAATVKARLTHASLTPRPARRAARPPLSDGARRCRVTAPPLFAANRRF